MGLQARGSMCRCLARTSFIMVSYCLIQVSMSDTYDPSCRLPYFIYFILSSLFFTIFQILFQFKNNQKMGRPTLHVGRHDPAWHEPSHACGLCCAKALPAWALHDTAGEISRAGTTRHGQGIMGRPFAGTTYFTSLHLRLTANRATPNYLIMTLRMSTSFLIIYMALH